MESALGARLSLLVNDYDEAIRFYCEQTQLFALIANLTLGPDSRYVVLGYTNPDAPFCLVVYRVTEPMMIGFVGHQAGSLPLFVLPVNDCVGTYERMRAAGVAFLGEPIELPYGCQATAIDPFGNRFCLSERY